MKIIDFEGSIITIDATCEKYADKYKIWNTLLLKFNPMDASVQ